MTNDVKIVVADDPDHEELFAEISFRESYVCTLSFENGPNDFVVEFLTPTDGLSIPLPVLEEAIREARQRLLGRHSTER